MASSLNVIVLLLSLLLGNSIQTENVQLTFKCLVDQCSEAILEVNLSNRSFSIELSKSNYLANCYYINKYNSNSTTFASVEICDQNRINSWFTYANSCYHIYHNITLNNYVVANCDAMLNMFPRLDYNPYKRRLKNMFYQTKRSIVKGTYESQPVLFIEMVYVIEYAIYVLFDKNETQLLSKIRTITNIVNSFLSELKVTVFITDLVIEKTCCEIINDNEGLKFLNEIKKIVEGNVDVILIVGSRLKQSLMHDIKYKVVGRAITHAICTQYSTAKVKYDIRELVTSITIVHEIGHLLGFGHIDMNFDACDCNKDHFCIMTSLYTEKNNTIWSNCTRAILHKFNIKNRYICLRNIPSKSFYASHCGNGILEDGEECDCVLSECSACCNKCKLTRNSSCGTGFCCDFKTCQFISKSLKKACRQRHTDCDEEEYCNGLSEFCPEDHYKPDGSSCLGGYCMNKICNSHQAHCEAIWGRNASPCLDIYNKIYSKSGKFFLCSKVGINAEFRSCKIEDGPCGLLYCSAVGTNFREPQPLIPYKVLFKIKFPSDTTYSFNGCMAIQVIENRFKWKYTPNGAVCGSSSVCLNRECTKLNFSLAHDECSKTCNYTCICNDDKHCQCVDIKKWVEEEVTVKYPWRYMLMTFIILKVTCFIVFITFERWRSKSQS